MTAEKRQMIDDTARIVENIGRQLGSSTIEEEDLLKLARALQFTSMSIQAIVELPDRKGK